MIVDPTNFFVNLGLDKEIYCRMFMIGYFYQQDETFWFTYGTWIFTLKYSLCFFIGMG